VVAWAGRERVQIVSSTPKPGYKPDVSKFASDSIMISFFADHKVSRVWVRWWNGPYAEITESVQ
jgi:hypothetical protein